MNQTRLVEQTQSVQQLLCEDSNESGAQPSELILLDQFVKIDAQQLKDQAKMLSMDERILQAKKVVIVVLVKLAVQLRKQSAMFERSRQLR